MGSATNITVSCMCHWLDVLCCVVCLCMCVWFCCTHGSPAICSTLWDTRWWRLSHPLARIRAILPPSRQRCRQCYGQGGYRKRTPNWFCSANTNSWRYKVIHIQTLDPAKKNGLENWNSVLKTCIYVMDFISCNNGYDKDEEIEKNNNKQTKYTPQVLVWVTVAVLWTFCEDAELKTPRVKIWKK